MSTPEQYEEARSVAKAFNAKHGHKLLQVAEPAPEAVSTAELRQLCVDHPGEYVAANVFRAIKGRAPAHSEAVMLGHHLSHLGTSRRKVGQQVFWRLDDSFAARAT